MTTLLEFAGTWDGHVEADHGELYRTEDCPAWTHESNHTPYVEPSVNLNFLSCILMSTVLAVDNLRNPKFGHCTANQWEPTMTTHLSPVNPLT